MPSIQGPFNTRLDAALGLSQVEGALDHPHINDARERETLNTALLSHTCNLMTSNYAFTDTGQSILYSFGLTGKKHRVNEFPDDRVLGRNTVSSGSSSNDLTFGPFTRCRSLWLPS